MERAPKDTTVILRVSAEQDREWRAAAERASSRMVASGAKPLTYSEWIRRACMTAYAHGE